LTKSLKCKNISHALSKSANCRRTDKTEIIIAPIADYVNGISIRSYDVNAYQEGDESLINRIM